MDSATAKRTSARLPNAHLTLARCRAVIVWGADLASGYMFPCKPLLDRLRASSDVSSSAAGIGGLDTGETTAAGQTCASGTCIAEAGECRRGLSPASRVAGHARRHPSAGPRPLPAVQVFAHRSAAKDSTSRAEVCSGELGDSELHRARIDSMICLSSLGLTQAR